MEKKTTKKTVSAKQLAALKKGREALKKKQKVAKKQVRKELSKTKKSIKKSTSKIMSNARLKASKNATKQVNALQKRLHKKGLAGNKVTIKEVVTSDNWIIKKVLQGRDGLIRIDATTRYHIADGQNFFSEWCTKKYVDKLRSDEGYGPISITHY